MHTFHHFVKKGWRYLPSGHYTSFKVLILKKGIIRFKLIHIFIVIGLWSVMWELDFVITDWNRRSLMKKGAVHNSGRLLLMGTLLTH